MQSKEKVMTHTKDEALKLALEALKFFKGLALSIEEIERAEEAITALQSIINQDALHKMAEESRTSGLRLDDWDKIGCVNHDCDKCKAQPAPTVQEPVARIDALADNDCAYAYADGWNACVEHHKTIAKATPPAQPAPVPLTDDQISAIGSKIFPSTWNTRHVEFARAIEAAKGITATPEKGQP
jgi:hypothetical protein